MANNKKSGSKEKVIKEYIDLLYMTPLTITAKDISNLFEANKDFSVQLWEDMNVLELELPNDNSIDFEPLDVNLKDPSDAAFVKNRNIQTIFALALCKTDLDTVIPLFNLLVEKFQGFVCADTENFNPVYAGSSKKE